MKIQIATAAIALATVMGTASAATWNKKTKLDVRETILIPGKELPPGKYVMKLLDSQSNRHIVQIMNEDESKLEATILAIPNWRLQPKGDTELRYWETPAGTPPALRAWFYPGDNFGQEFAYPKDVASRISTANNKESVAWYDNAQDAKALRTIELHDAERAREQAEVATAPPPPAQPANEGRAANLAAAPERTAQAPDLTPATPVAPAPPANEPTLLAQNRPPAAAPAPSAAEPAPAQLPQTASELWALGLSGCVLLAAAFALFAGRRA